MSAEGTFSSKQINFTQKALEALPPNPPDARSRECEYSDTRVIGLKLLVNKAGRKFFYLRYTFRKRKRAVRIGEFGPTSLQEARRRATEMRGQIDRGIDPQAEKVRQRAIPSFAEFTENDYLPYARANKRSHRTDELRLKQRVLPVFGRLRLDELDRLTIQRFMDRLKAELAPATVNRFLSLIHRMMKLAVEWGYLTENPAMGIRKLRENNEVQRFLDADELRRFLTALQGSPYRVVADYLLYLLLTGARKSEAANARWRDIDFDRRLWVIPMSKSGKSRMVPLNDQAVELLRRQKRGGEGNIVFPGRRQGQPLSNPYRVFEQVLKEAGIDNLRLHDLRHSHASMLVNSGATLYEVQAVLGHSESKTTQRYAHLADSTLHKRSAAVSDAVAQAGAIK